MQYVFNIVNLCRVADSLLILSETQMIKFYMLLNDSFVSLVSTNYLNAMQEIDSDMVVNCDLYRNNTLIAVKKDSCWHLV